MPSQLLRGVRDVVAMPTVDFPVPAPGEVLVEVGAVGLCGSDLAAYRGVHPRMHAPLVLGHEFAGTVIELGRGIGTVSHGDRVVVDPMIACGACRSCRSARPNVCETYRLIGCDPRLPGALAGYVNVPAAQLVRLPQACTLSEGALVQPLAISHHAVAVRGQVGSGTQVLIIGCGPVGLGCLLVAVALGANVIAVDVDPYRLAAARRMGATKVVDAGDAAAVKEIKDASADGPAVIIEAAGGRQTDSLELAVQAVRPGGRIVVVGNFAAGTRAIDAALLKTKELDVVGSQGYTDSFRTVLAMMASGQLKVANLISHSLPMSKAARAFELLDATATQKLKIVLKSAARRGIQH